MGVREKIAREIYRDSLGLEQLDFSLLTEKSQKYYLDKADPILSAVLQKMPKDKPTPKYPTSLNSMEVAGICGYNNAKAEIREILK
jgi:hypothetical protein